MIKHLVHVYQSMSDSTLFDFKMKNQ